MTSKEDKINYINLILKDKNLLKQSTFRWLNEYLANIEVEEGDIRNAAKAFKNADDKEMARECNSTNKTFSKKDEKTLTLLQEKLNKLNT
jgi:hypothetical protein